MEEREHYLVLTRFRATKPQLQPAQAADILNERVRQVGRLNVAVADWLQVRREDTASTRGSARLM